MTPLPRQQKCYKSSFIYCTCEPNLTLMAFMTFIVLDLFAVMFFLFGNLFSFHYHNNIHFQLYSYTLLCVLSPSPTCEGGCVTKMFIVPLCLVSIRSQWDRETAPPKHAPAHCTKFCKNLNPPRQYFLLIVINLSKTSQNPPESHDSMIPPPSNGDQAPDNAKISDREITKSNEDTYKFN